LALLKKIPYEGRKDDGSASITKNKMFYKEDVTGGEEKKRS